MFLMCSMLLFYCIFVYNYLVYLVMLYVMYKYSIDVSIVV